MFAGLSAFPLTPVNESEIQVEPFVQLIKRLVMADVDSIGVLGSTGNYAYLSRNERSIVTKVAIEHAEGIPVMVGIGALRTKDVLELAEDAQRLGASAVMLAPVSYQKLSVNEVFGLYEDVTRELSIPLCVYDNPSTTNFGFDDELYIRVAQLPNVSAIKIAPLTTAEYINAKIRIDNLREILPAHISIGISGDWCGFMGLWAGCNAWYSAIGGVLPQQVIEITRAVKSGDLQRAKDLNHALTPLMDMIRKYGSLRVSAASAQILKITTEPFLPLPIHGLSVPVYEKLEEILEVLNLLDK